MLNKDKKITEVTKTKKMGVNEKYDCYIKYK